MALKYVILDCDGGSDDAWALLFLLKAEEEERIRLLAITICGCGNTNLENATRNVVRVLKAAGRSNVPIYYGAADALISMENKANITKFHGDNGFGDVQFDDAELINIEEFVGKEHAVSVIKDLCAKYPKMVSLIGIGPLTNIALCYSMYGKEFAESVGSTFIMGGNHLGIGNSSRAAEFNFYCDPEAAYIVLEKSVCPITILPWEPCMDERFFIDIQWRLEVLGKQATSFHAAIDILNKVEFAQWIPPGHKNWNSCDAILVAVFLFDEQIIEKQSQWHATVDLRGSHTRGQMVLDHLHEIDINPKNVRIVELVNVDFFKSKAEWVAGLRETSLNGK